MINITSLDTNSEKRESTAIAYPRNDPTLLFTVTGTIGADYFSASRAGSSYHVHDDFDDILWEKVNSELSKNQFSFEIGDGADYNQVAANILDYLNQLRLLLDDYKSGDKFNYYFTETHLRGRIPLTLNGDDIEREIIIDSSNGKVVVDTFQSEHGWKGELEIEEYLQLLATGQLEKKIDEIRIGHGYTSLYGNS